MVSAWILTVILAASPIFELRGAIPFGIAAGLNPLLVIFSSVAINIVMIPVIFLVLDFAFEHLVFKIPWLGRVLQRAMDRANRKGSRYIETYGVLGLTLFVAVPLPVTGAYTGCLLAQLLKMDRKKAIPAIAIGVLIAGTIVSLVSVGVLNIFTRFIG